MYSWIGLVSADGRKVERLIEMVVKIYVETPANYKRLYDNDLSVQEKIERLLLKSTVAK